MDGIGIMSQVDNRAQTLLSSQWKRRTRSIRDGQQRMGIRKQPLIAQLQKKRFHSLRKRRNNTCLQPPRGHSLPYRSSQMAKMRAEFEDGFGGVVPLCGFERVD